MVCGFLSFACLMYMICHGANFYRCPVERLMELDTSKKTAEHLLAVCEELAQGAAQARAEIELNLNGKNLNNGGTATWTSGSNTLTVTVKNGNAVRVYTLTVTKS